MGRQMRSELKMLPLCPWRSCVHRRTT
jgi:hypothetical protein